jgi:hypothetical protein
MSNFDISKDLKIELLLPQDGLFTLGISLLGGPDVLGSGSIFILGESLLGSTDVLSNSARSFAWQNIECETAKVEISVGGAVEDAATFEPYPSTGSFVIQSSTFDPNNNPNIRANTKIRASVQTQDISRVLFIGYIDTIDVTYYTSGLNLITINAFDLYKSIVNTRLDSFDTTGLPADFATPYEVFLTLADALESSLSPFSVPVEGKLPKTSQTDVIPAEIMNDAIEVGLAIVWVDPITEKLTIVPRPSASSVTSDTFTIGNNHGDPNHLCMSEINVKSDADRIFNSLTVTRKDELGSVTVKDQDLIDLYGISSLDKVLNVEINSELTRWASAVFAQTSTKLVESVTTPSIDRKGNITESAFFIPGMLVGVSYTTDNVSIEGYYSIIRVNHSIDVNTWLTTLELWRAV